MRVRRGNAQARILATLSTALLWASVAIAKPVAKAPHPQAGPAEIVWVDWSDAVFARAKADGRLVILDLEAIWCHWCHVMAETTYRSAPVVQLITEHYIAVRVDQDSRPDLANRYEDYGWPATIIFRGDGAELAKRSGYIEPASMAAVLQAFVDSPEPGPSVRPEEPLAYAKSPFLGDLLRGELEKIHNEAYDNAHGGWGFDHKFLDPGSTEFALDAGRAGDAAALAMAKATLAGERRLIDPAWGGVYQYSTGGDWNTPHFEKIIAFQADVMRLYALAFAQIGDAADQQAARDVFRYIKSFLTSPEGAFYTSQDADLVQGEHSAEYFKLDDVRRRKLGIPRVDRGIYARENGWMIYALTYLYGVTGDASALAAAKNAAAWVVAHRASPGGGFRHGEKDEGGPFLGDSLAMGQALLALHGVTGERPYLAQSEAALRFVAENFAAKEGPGFITAPGGRPNRDENIVVVRYANLLHHYTGEAEFRSVAETAMRYLATPAVAGKLPTGGILLADRELARPPTHLTIVGGKQDPGAQALFRAALRYPAAYKRVEWWDRSEGPLRHAEVPYPELKVAAAFVCTGTRCSLPIRKADDVLPKAALLEAGN